jgi:hypothetical protein
MDIPNWRFNSTERIAHEFQTVEFQALNELTVVGEASKQRDLPLPDKLFASTPRPTSRVQNAPIVWVAGNSQLFCESSKRFIHSQIIAATIERPSRTSPGTPPLFSFVPYIALINFRWPTLAN